MILGCLAGDAVTAIAERCQTRPNTVIKWRQRFAERGLKGLTDAPRPGAKPVYKSSFLAVISQSVIICPRDTASPDAVACWSGSPSTPSPPMKSALFRTRSLRSTLVAFLGLVLASANLASAQIADRPKPGPEQQKLAVFLGEWTYEGTLRDSVLGPGGKFVGKETVRWTLDGLFVETRGQDKGVYGGKEMQYEGQGLRWYDAAAKQYKSHHYDNDGFVNSATMTVAGKTWTVTGSSANSKGQKMKSRVATTFSADGKSQTSKCEVSFDDGKAWVILWETAAKQIKG